VSQNANSPIRNAKVTLDFQGAPPVVYTDSEGVYRFTINVEGDKISGRVKVEADNYEKYDRNITLHTDIATIEDIRLVPLVPPLTPSPTNASTPIPTVTLTPSPTSRPIQSTSTPTPIPPTFTPAAEPQNESQLKSIGEGYSLNGVSLTLKDYSIGSSDINLWFVVKNESSGNMTIRYQNSYFELYDDTGRKYDRDVSCEYDTKQQQFEPGDTVTLDDGNGCYFADIGDFEGVIGQNASYLIVKVSQFMDLQDMQWQIDF